MSQREDVLRILAEQPGGLTDAQLTAELRRTRSKVVHQTANALCRALAADGLIVRDAANGPIVNRLAVAAPVMPPVDFASSRPWPWEGAVQGLVVDRLGDLGARIESQADTARREHGTDVVAVLAGRRLHVEVKGWPGREYADLRRAGETKRTPPTMQAAHWFAGAVSSAMKLRHVHPRDRVVVALPDLPRYRTLHGEGRSRCAGSGSRCGWWPSRARSTRSAPQSCPIWSSEPTSPLSVGTGRTRAGGAATSSVYPPAHRRSGYASAIQFSATTCRTVMAVSAQTRPAGTSCPTRPVLTPGTGWMRSVGPVGSRNRTGCGGTCCRASRWRSASPVSYVLTRLLPLRCLPSSLGGRSRNSTR